MSALAARRLYIVAYCTVAAALLWLIVSVAVSGELAQSDPALALRWRPHDPPALVELAQASLDNQKPAQARSYALEAIAHGPHDATAWRLLGQAALAGSNPALAEQLFAQTGRLTHRDATLAAWFFEEAVGARRYGDAVRYADVVIRRAPDKENAMVFRLAALAQDPAAVPALAQGLGRKPQWRGAFFKELASGSSNSAVAARLLEQMTAANTPLTTDELSGLLIPMARGGQAQDAYRLWLATLPPAARPTGPVFDPTFAGPPAAAPFGWSLNDEGDDRSQIGGPGLRIDLEGHKPQRLAMQMLVTPPGRYRFETAGRLIDGQEELLSWVLGCPGQKPVLLDLFRGRTAVAAAEFEIAADCPNPALILNTLARDHDLPATVVVDRVTLQKIG